MSPKILHRTIGFTVFIITLIVYAITVQPSVPFWDCGEFIASSVLLQVPHPPGTPLFLLLGRIFSMIPFAEDIGLRVNLISVFSSAFTILFLYLSAVKLIEIYKDNPEESLSEKLITYFAAAMGALSLAFSDTFWFNGAEAEVYAFSTFFISVVTWMIIVWYQKADDRDNEKYLLFIAYLIGLSIGVHLMAVLATVSVVMIIMMRKYITDEEVFKKTGYIFLGHAALLTVIALAMWATYTDSTAPMPEEFKAVDQKFILVFAVVSVIYMGIFWKKIWNKNSFYLPIVLGGITLFTVYPGVVKYVPNLILSLGKNDAALGLLIIFALFAGTAYVIYWSTKNKKQTLRMISKAFLFVLIGYTSMSMIIIRSNMDPPINLNSPKDMEGFVSYVNREQYGDFPTFKRRFSMEGKHQQIFKDYSSDLEFLVRYQMNHMFHRYLLWNYAGRISTLQDSGVDWTKLWGIPLLLGLFGVYFHFKKDWRLASSFLVMFLFLGYLTAFYQNQQQPQPRERDYFYVGAFFVYSLWIALGIRGIFDLLKEQIGNTNLFKPAVAGTLILSFAFVPLNMFLTNFKEHDRSQDYLPNDYAYNLLQSVEKDAILFTNGDNDTFPLWYLQDVAGIRRDVRIACLSLMNTPWYILQLKNNTPHGAKKVPMNLSDTEIERLTPVRWETRTFSIDVTPELIKEYNVTDPQILETGKLTWNMAHTEQFGSVKAVKTQDIAVLDIFMANKWERPIYFAVSTPDNAKIGLTDYLRMEGIAHRLVPKKRAKDEEYVEEDILRAQLLTDDVKISKDYQPGFILRGLDNPDNFFDDNHIRICQNFRNTYMRLAIYYYTNTMEDEKAIEILDKMEEKIPRATIPLDYRIKHDIAKIYFGSGGMEQYKVLAAELIAKGEELLAQNPRDFSGWYNPYQLLLTHYENLKEYDKAINVLLKLKALVPGDQSVDAMILKLQNEKKATEENKE